MRRKKKIISVKIEDNDYNIFFQEMVLAERSYHKNEKAFNEHVNNILNMKNPDYIYRVFLKIFQLKILLLVIQKIILIQQLITGY